MAKGCDVNNVGVLWMHPNPRYLSRVLKANPLPRFSTVIRFVNAITMRYVSTYWRLAHPDIDRVGIRVRHSDSAYRASAENRRIANGFPIDPSVSCLPNASTSRAVVENHRLRRHTCNGG